MTVVSAKVRGELLALPTIRQNEAAVLAAQIHPNPHDYDPGDLKIDTQFQGLDCRQPLRVYVSPRKRDYECRPSWPYTDNNVQVFRYDVDTGYWVFGSKKDFERAYACARLAGIVPG